MSEVINIEIQADKSAADEALGQVKKSLDEGKQAADALSHVLDGDLSGAFKQYMTVLYLQPICYEHLPSKQRVAE